MINFLLQLDTGIFLLLNNGFPHNGVFDALFNLLTGIGNYGAVWFIVAVVFLIIEEVKDHKGLLALLFSSAAVLVIVDRLLKNFFHRMRPEMVLTNIHVTPDPSANFSFPSTHAAIAFSGAYILSKRYPSFRAVWYLVAVGISFSRIYLGKHYPSDVLVGAFIGWCIGYVSLYAVERWYGNGKK